jgi:hypothetical protein
VTCSPAGLLPSDLKGKGWTRAGRWGCRWSVDGQDAHATGAAAGAAEVTGIASGGLHRDVETSGVGIIEELMVTVSCELFFTAVARVAPLRTTTEEETNWLPVTVSTKLGATAKGPWLLERSS